MTQQLTPTPQGHERLATTLGSLARRYERIVKFGLVGVSGIAVNTVVLALAVSGMSLPGGIGMVLATQASTTWNYALANWFVFDTSNSTWTGTSRYVQFSLMNNLALIVRGPMVFLLISWLGMNYLIANLISLVLLVVARYVMSVRLIWHQSGSVSSLQEPDVHVPTEIADRAPALAPASDPPLEIRPEPDAVVAGRARIPTRPLRPVKKAVEPALVQSPARSPRPSLAVALAATATVTLPAVFLRLWHLGTLGFNSDEAVYAGQGASIAGDTVLLQYFPIFRAHPLLFQTSISVVYQWGTSPLAGRMLSAAFGIATVAVTYLLGSFLYNRRVGFLAALLLAVMPYHVVVTRQVLLDGPMVFFATLALYLLARYAATERPVWLYSAASMLGLTFLANERSIVLLGGAYAFFAVSSAVKVRFRDLVAASVIFVLVITPYPLSVSFSGKSTTGEQFLAWQLFRRANHEWPFYWVTVPQAIGLLVVAAALAGLWFLWGRRSWREVLLLCWIVVPVVFFQIWPVKGFQYLLPLSTVFAVLAGRSLDGMLDWRPRLLDRLAAWHAPPWLRRVPIGLAVVVLVIGMTALDSVNRVRPATAGTSFLAGSGGVPGGREAGEWVKENVPEGASLLAVGPSMANIIQFYGDRKTWGLSVSPNPLHRNPVYEPVLNPDFQLRSSEIQYLVWDSFSASRSEFFSEKIFTFAERYNGRIVHVETVETRGDDGSVIDTPVIIIYEVRP